MAVSARADITYNFASGGGTTHRAYKDRIPNSPIPPTNNTIPATEFSSSNYGRLIASDNVRYATGNIGSGYRSASRFVFSIAQAPESISSLSVLWEGRAQNGGFVHVYLWNAHTSSYEMVGSTSSTVDINIANTYHAHPSHYIDGLGKLTLLALNTWSDRGLTTDFVKVSIAQCQAHADCDDENSCTDDVCNSGVCSHTNRTGSCSDGNPCTLGDQCSSGICVGGAPPDCSSACDQCNTASCDPQGPTGNCNIHTPRPDGLPCEDGQFCSTNEVCVAGVCQGADRDCSAVSDQCNRGVCDEDSDSCKPEFVEDGRDCDDGVPCTRDDSCHSGTCAGTSRNCEELSDSCNIGYCDGESGECRTRPVEDGLACDDGSFCTVSDVCTAGVCGGAQRDCGALSNQCNTGHCNEETNECESRPVQDGTACNDETYCTVNDICTAGACVGAERDCSASGDLCNSGVCNEESDSCEPMPVTNGTGCDDGHFCTVGDVCTDGTCAGAPRDCSASSDSCNTGVCNEEADECRPSPVADGTECNDDLYCSTGDACFAGRCVGQPRDCSALNNACNTGVCSEKLDSCQPRPVEDGVACDDGRYCTVQDACSGGLCLGDNRDCSAMADQCHSASCDEKRDECRAVALPDGTSCDDGQLCTLEDACADGACSGAPRDCSTLSDSCHAGVCNEDTGACEGRTYEDGTTCDDELYCTINDACQEGLCTGNLRDCSDLSDACNLGLCNENLNECVAQPLPDETVCSDGNACTIGDACIAGQCSPGPDTDCSTLETQCTRVACDPIGTSGNCSLITAVEDGTSCDDGSYCTSGEVCKSGTCFGGILPCGAGTRCDENGDACVECLEASHCDDGISCTEDICDDGECLHRPNNELCPDNGAHCDGREYCDEQAGCVSSGDPCPADELCDESTDTCGECLVDADCEDSVGCTRDRCVSGGCVYKPDNDLCESDGQYCTGGEVCDASHGCISTGNPCSKGEFCNDQSETCDECRDDSDCDDGDPCTVGHSCEAGRCRTARAVDCSEHSSDCTRVTCDPNGATGNCDVVTLAENGSSCDDGAYCTVDDSCVNGLCLGTSRDCGGLSDQCNLGDCDEETDECRAHPIADGASCSDGLFCTAGDTCRSGICNGEPRDCSFATDTCNRGVCDEDYNACVALPADDGSPCEDAYFCTVNEVCVKGICRGQFRSCDEAADQCNTGVCNEKTNECVAVAVEDGVVCDDGNHCVLGEACHAGRCEGGITRDCSDYDDACNTASCDPKGEPGNCRARSPLSDGTPCDDGAYCTTADSCTSGVCGGNPLDCSGEADQCHSAECNEDTNECVTRPLEDGTACDDGEFCTSNDVCKSGVCGGDALECGDSSDSCTVLVCNEEMNACESRPAEDGLACDDGLRCTTGDACHLGTCRGELRNCTGDGDVCSVAYCDEETGECSVRAAEDGTSCDDGVRCTKDDVCRDGTCSGTALDCDGLDDTCNRGTCNEETGECEARPLDDGIPCEDGLFCSVSEVCKSGVCAGGVSRDCGDISDQCNTGVCNEDSDACEVRTADDGLDCDDGLYCTVDDSCRGGLCTGTARDCGQSKEACVVLTCSEESDSCETQTAEDGAACNDEYECTDDDVCTAGTCKGSRHFGLEDWTAIQSCLAGIDQGIEPQCECMDLDGDGHVDLIDVSEFMRAYTGP